MPLNFQSAGHGRVNSLLSLVYYRVYVHCFTFSDMKDFLPEAPLGIAQRCLIAAQ